MDMNMQQMAIQRLQQLEQATTGWKQGIDQWGRERMSQIDNYKMQLGQMGQYTPQQVVAQEMNFTPPQAAISDEFNPYAIQRKKLAANPTGLGF